MRFWSGEYSLSSAGHFAGLRINAYQFAFLDKERHANDKTRFQSGLLGGAPRCGVALHPRFRGNDYQLNELRELQGNRSAVVFQYLQRSLPL